MGEVISLDARRSASDAIELDELADELGLDAGMLWAWMAVESVRRERLGQPALDPRDDAERVMIDLRGEAALLAAMDRIDAARRQARRRAMMR